MNKSILLLTLISVVSLGAAGGRLPFQARRLSSSPRTSRIGSPIAGGEWRGVAQIRQNSREDFGDVDSSTYAGNAARRILPSPALIRVPTFGVSRSVSIPPAPSSSPLPFRQNSKHRLVAFAQELPGS